VIVGLFWEMLLLLRQLVIRAKEVAQAKIAEAMEVAAIKDAQETPTVEPTSAVAPSISTSQAERQDEEVGDPESITVASLTKGIKRRVPKVVLPPRTNLRSTPARQARALISESQ
jgi:hypothetical protein